MDRQNLINRLVARKLQPAGNGQPRRGLCGPCRGSAEAQPKKLQPAGNGQPRRGLCGPTTCWARTRCSAGTRRSGTAVEDGP